MLMRTDPFGGLDRLTQQVLNRVPRPSVMPMTRYRKGDEFFVQFDLPGVDTGFDRPRSGAERAHGEGRPSPGRHGGGRVLGERMPVGHLHKAAVLGRDARPGSHRGRLQRWRAHPHHPGARGGQATQGRDHLERQRPRQAALCRVLKKSDDGPAWETPPVPGAWAHTDNESETVPVVEALMTRTRSWSRVFSMAMPAASARASASASCSSLNPVALSLSVR